MGFDRFIDKRARQTQLVREDDTEVILVYVIGIVKASLEDILIGANANELDLGSEVLCFVHVLHGRYLLA